MAVDYPPYVNGYGGIPKLFAAVREAAVPPKFTQDFLNDVLDLKSSSYRAMIPLMKKLGFIDPANVPTQAYRDVRDPAQAGRVMAERMREAYKTLFSASEYIYKLDKPTLMTKLRSILGAGEDDANIQYVAGTFAELSRMAIWEGVATSRPSLPSNSGQDASVSALGKELGKFGLSYTINLNLPATTEIEVFNAIFKSLRENLLREI
jgi:Family of unknown function (DUF5343)